MTITTNWNIANLERNTADGKVTTVHYTIDATDGTYNAGAYGSIGVDGDVAIAYKDLTADVVVGWVKAALTDEKVKEVEAALVKQIEEQVAPTKAAGLPW
jgi:hypothetical protein